MLNNATRPNNSLTTDNNPLTKQTLAEENVVYLHTGGRSQESPFLPAFKDMTTDDVFLSRFANGKLAPLHIFDGLPDYCVIQRDEQGHVTAIRSTLVSGFVKAGQFFTRAEAAACS